MQTQFTRFRSYMQGSTKVGPDLCQQIQWPLLHTSLFCCPSMTAQALRAAMVAAELPLRGKLRAKATIFSTHPLILQVPLPMLACTVCTGKSNNLAPNCPVLNPWAKLYVQTALVLLGAYFRPRIRRRALRAPFLDPRTFLNVALRAVRLPLVELAIIIRMYS